MKPKTIKEAVEVLQKSIAAVLPGMQVSVSINLVSLDTQYDTQEVTIKLPKDIPEDLEKAIDLAALRTYLNSYVKKAGAEKAIKLVGKYTSGSKDAADIPVEKYPDIVSEISEEYPEMVLSFKGKDDA